MDFVYNYKQSYGKIHTKTGELKRISSRSGSSIRNGEG